MSRKDYKTKGLLFFKYWRDKQFFRHCHMSLEKRYISMDEYDSIVAKACTIDFDEWWDTHMHPMEIVSE